jgi:hypothetical protein
VSDLAEVPGYTQAEAALCRYLDQQNFWYGENDAGQIVALVMGVSRPYVQAEVLADAADYLDQLGLHELATILDNVSAGIRKAVGSV